VWLRRVPGFPDPGLIPSLKGEAESSPRGRIKPRV